MLHEETKKRDSSIPLLVAAAGGALLFTLAAGFFGYTNTQRLVSSKDWVEHTQEVLTSLQSAWQMDERIEFSEKLAYATNSDAPLNRSLDNAIELETLGKHIQWLVADNRVDDWNVGKLVACTEEIQLNVILLKQHRAADFSSIPKCREALSFLIEEERRLKVARIKRSDHDSAVSFYTGFVLAGLFLVTTLVLFGFMLRDALRRAQAQRQAAITNANLEASIEALEENEREARLLTTWNSELQLCVDVQQVYQTATSGLGRLLPSSSGALYMINSSRSMVELASSWGEPEAAWAPADTFLPDACCGLRLGQIRWRREGGSEIDCAHFVSEAPERYFCVPMVAQGHTMGVLHVECMETQALMAVNQRMEGVRQILQLTGMTVAALNLRVKLENQSIRDALTGLFNRHFMEIVLERELSRASRQQSMLGVFMLDVDHFKVFNDTFGHAAGDTMLRAVADVFSMSVRSEDTVCRYGGEEFAIILPGITTEAAYQRAELICQAVARLHVPLGDGVFGETTVSVGVALYPDDASDGGTLLRKADQALYRAKHAGRNRVALSGAMSAA